MTKRKKRNKRKNRAKRSAARRRQRHAESPPTRRAASPSPAQQAVEHVEVFDRCAHARNQLRALAEQTDEWAGFPLPIEGEELIVDPSYPWADFIGNHYKRDREAAEDSLKIRNEFYSHKLRRYIVVFEDDGKIKATLRPYHPLDYLLRTMGCADAWGIEQESRAVHTLAQLLGHKQFKQYMLTGLFIETSQRSRISYVFRRLRPTVAIATQGDKLNILCTMCMHPIGYYDGSFAGAMCPTDDVIAHLMLMRGDEHMFWKRCNQHDPNMPQAGLTL